MEGVLPVYNDGSYKHPVPHVDYLLWDDIDSAKERVV